MSTVAEHVVSETEVSVRPRVEARRTTAPGTTIPFDVLNEPGAYVCNWSGHLLRVRENALRAMGGTSLNIIGDQPLTLTKISDDPDVVLSRAKHLAEYFRIDAHF